MPGAVAWLSRALVIIRLASPERLFPKQPQQQREQQAQEQAGYEWEMKAEVPFGVMNVSR